MHAVRLPEPYRITAVSREQLGGFKDAIAQLWRGELAGLLIRGVLPAATIERVVSRLDSNAVELPRMIFPQHRGEASPPYVMCRGLITSPPDLADYFADAVRFRAGLVSLFEGEAPFEETIIGLLEQIGGGRRVSLARGPNDEPYSPATIRVITSGHRIARHCELDFLSRPECDHLNTLIDTSTQLSYFIPLEAPKRGGELVLTRDQWGQADIYGEDVPGVAVSIAPGDMFVFDGGRIYHELSRVAEGGRRVSIGGFVTYSKDQSKLYLWT